MEENFQQAIKETRTKSLRTWRNLFAELAEAGMAKKKETAILVQQMDEELERREDK